jgi:hypothetical protein
MLKWRYPADSPALFTAAGLRADGAITSEPGCALYGPYIDIPAGRCTAGVHIEGTGPARIELTADSGQRILAVREADLSKLSGARLEVSADIGEAQSACEVRVQLTGHARITGVEIALDPQLSSRPDPDRPVGHESRKTYAEKLASGFIQRYLSGSAIVEVGYKGYMTGIVPIVPQAIGVDIDYPGYDGVRLPFEDDSVDAIYSSHCFEHVPDEQAVLRDWWRVLKTGGYIVLVVPHRDLFEKRAALPSLGNSDHKKFYTPAVLLETIEKAFSANTYRVRHLCDNDKDYDYSMPPREPSHGCYEIELVLEKIEPPFWTLDDGTVRPYAAGEFLFAVPGRKAPWSFEADLPMDGCAIYGPYVNLQPGRYEAEFFVDVDGDGERLALTAEVGCGAESLASREFEGGSVIVPFSTGKVGGPFEFRTFVSGRASAGKIIFRGVDLRCPRRG